jgi:hypothetical protein
MGLDHMRNKNISLMKCLSMMVASNLGMGVVHHDFVEIGLDVVNVDQESEKMFNEASNNL